MQRRHVPLALSGLALGAWHRCASPQSNPSTDGRPLTQAADPAFDQVARKIDIEYPDVRSVVVVRNGRRLFEHHATGPDTLHDVQSVTKSVLSLALGAAMGRGALGSLDQPVGELIGVASKSGAASPWPPVTVRHLLTMTAGFRTQDRFAPGTADDPAFLLGRERVESPGSSFAYDNLCANLLSIVLELATGQPASAFTEQEIFRPLGINSYHWAKGSNGHTLGFSGLRLRTADMAKLGELALSAGAWEGRQIVSEAYARQAVTPQSVGGPPVGLAYGFLWWVVPSADMRRTFLASGWGGQFIWVHPALNLVIAITSTVSPDANRRGQALTLIRTDLLRAAAAAQA